MTKDEKDYLSRVVELGCAVCRRLGYDDSPAEIHHIRTGQGRKRASHYDTVPMCFRHHRGNDGIHGLGTKGFAKHYGFTELELLEETKCLLSR